MGDLEAERGGREGQGGIPCLDRVLIVGVHRRQGVRQRLSPLGAVLFALCDAQLAPGEQQPQDRSEYVHLGLEQVDGEGLPELGAQRPEPFEPSHRV